jgi:hypothetical protein
LIAAVGVALQVVLVFGLASQNRPAGLILVATSVSQKPEAAAMVSSATWRCSSLVWKIPKR